LKDKNYQKMVPTIEVDGFDKDENEDSLVSDAKPTQLLEQLLKKIKFKMGIPIRTMVFGLSGVKQNKVFLTLIYKSDIPDTPNLH
jgi:hypothetical protein